MNLLPSPRVLKRGRGFYALPERSGLHLDPSIKKKEALLIAGRLRKFGVTPAGPEAGAAIIASWSRNAPNQAEGYDLVISRRGVSIGFRDLAGLRAAIATLRQLLREYGRRLPCLTIRDWPDFPHRGVMLDVSRGRVPKLETLLQLADHLADFKINQLQLYTEHTFAYRNYRAVWRDWGALTAPEISKLDARCCELGIELVPNQNSFGHLRQWLEHAPLKELGEVSAPYEDAGGQFVRRPSTLAPNHPGTLPFLRRLYDELLPNFSSRRFNVGCDETWDLGRGQSKALCDRLGKGRVYLDFLKRIHREVSSRGRQMMFWGDIVLHYPNLIRELPKEVVALNWGYEANHPFDREARLFAKAKIPFFVCPGTSTWMTLIGRNDNAFANLRRAAHAGRKHGAAGYLITDWGDGGHPQPLAVSYALFAAGAALSWCAKTFREDLLGPVLNRDIFEDRTFRAAKAALALGLAHRKFRFAEPNATPFGAVIAAPPPQERELFCRNGLRYYSRIAPENIRAALKAVENQRAILRAARPASRNARIHVLELDLAARMAAESCRIMLWQQALAANRKAMAKQMARTGIRELRALNREFNRYWSSRNKASSAKCSTFLAWRIRDYLSGVLPDSPG